MYSNIVLLKEWQQEWPNTLRKKKVEIKADNCDTSLLLIYVKSLFTLTLVFCFIFPPLSI